MNTPLPNETVTFFTHLRDCQRQLDMDGCEVGVSRQAVDEALAEIERLRAALVKSIEVIQGWHNMGLPAKQASELWDIYWRSAPEMKQIREALTALDVSEKTT